MMANYGDYQYPASFEDCYERLQRADRRIRAARTRMSGEQLEQLDRRMEAAKRRVDENRSIDKLLEFFK